MVCGTCVEKLAYKLMRNHNVDMIRAFELAEKGVERHETAEAKAVLPIQPLASYDYTLSCEASGVCICYGSAYDCTASAQCGPDDISCTCDCPTPKPHSHSVFSNCTKKPTSNCSCDTVLGVCRDGRTCTCGCLTGTYCGYNCDFGFVWNPVTLQCEAAVVVGVVVSAVQILSFLILTYMQQKRKRRRKSIIATFK